MIAIADEWLRLPPRTTEINVVAGTSNSALLEVLKRKGDGDVINGCFIMAAHRLGFKSVRLDRTIGQQAS